MQAPLAGIANWAFRRQSRRHGAGLAVSEMIASFGIRYANRKTLRTTDDRARRAPRRGAGLRRRSRAMAEAARAAEEESRPGRREHGLSGAEDLQDRRRGGAARRSRGRRPSGRGDGAGSRHPRDREDAPRAHPEHGGPRGDREAPRVRRRGRPVRAPGRRPRSTRAPTTASRPRWWEPSRSPSSRAETSPRRTARGGCWRTPAARRSRSDAARSATPGPSATSFAACRAPRLGEVVEEVGRFAGDARQALGDGRACGYMRKFYPVPRGSRRPHRRPRVLLTTPTLDEALQRLRALAASPAAA